MTYRDMQRQLKIYRNQGYRVPRLNSKKEILMAAIDDIETGKIPQDQPTKFTRFDNKKMCQIFDEKGRQATLDYLAQCGMVA